MNFKVFFTIVSLVLFQLVFSQRHDNVWLFSDSGIRSTSVNFISGEAQVVPYEIDIDLVKSASSICDEEGKLVLFTDGCNVYNAIGNIVENGEEINPGDTWNNFCDFDTGYPAVGQSSMFYLGREIH
ncbi:MAG: hypothetical protein AAF741_13790 [Bacteroidota bacterium]